MAAPLLVVIQGAPGVGKTTLMERLRHDLALPMLGKDEIKEFLFDTLPQSDREFSRLQGGASFEMLYAFARTFLGDGQSVLIEGAFMTEFGKSAIQEVIRTTGARCLELFCHAHEAVRQERFRMRAEGGQRHPAHMDKGTNVESPRASEPYASLDVGERIDIDMVVPLDEQYESIVAGIRRRMA